MSAWRGGFDGKCLSQADFRTHVDGLKFGAWRPAFLVVHNTGAPNLAQLAAGKGGETQRIRNLEHYYRNQQGWSAGPHLFVSPKGIYLGTPLTVQGTHTPSWNAISWGVEMFGDYDKDDFTKGDGAKVRDNAVFAIAVLYARLGREAASIRFHREDLRTTHKHCPGKTVDKTDMIARIEDAMADLAPGGGHAPARLKVAKAA